MTSAQLRQLFRDRVITLEDVALMEQVANPDELQSNLAYNALLEHLADCCPWCKSVDKSIRLDVPSGGLECYNDWHLPICKNCKLRKYTHGHAFGCQRYEAEVSRARS